ncbi:hypothetical protein MFLAVUS_006956 [Mucor flavus]|uniref:Uncharacterized protein n=1 Tax=Mucor flavus TaxID=439312 RepID=A0ABP9Z309_9FUNG
MESKSDQGGCIDYVYNCFKSLKDSFKDYQAYACGYDGHQYQRHAMDSGYKARFYPDWPTQSVDRLLNLRVTRSKRLKTLATNIADNVTHTFAYGAFAVANLIWIEKKYIEDFFEQNVCAKKSSGDDNDAFYDAYDDNTLSLKKPMEDTSYGFVDYDMQVQFVNTNPRPPKRPMDDSWGFVDYDDLSIQFKNVNSSLVPPPKPPRRVMRLRK